MPANPRPLLSELFNFQAALAASVTDANVPTPLHATQRGEREAMANLPALTRFAAPTHPMAPPVALPRPPHRERARRQGYAAATRTAIRNARRDAPPHPPDDDPPDSPATGAAAPADVRPPPAPGIAALRWWPGDGSNRLFPVRVVASEIAQDRAALPFTVCTGNQPLPVGWR